MEANDNFQTIFKKNKNMSNDSLEFFRHFKHNNA